MPRAVNQRCQSCASLAVEVAQQVHGSQGDGCWDFDRPYLCHARRTYYRVRAEKNAKRQAKRLGRSAVSETGQVIEKLAVPLAQAPVAFVYLYRENREAPLHAIGVSVWQGDEKIAEVSPVHCMGLTNSLVNDYLRRVLAVLKSKYGITQFKDEFYLSPGVCPLRPCPFQEHFVSVTQHSSS